MTITSLLTSRTGSILQDGIWIYIEPNTGIISACLPFLANIFGQYLREVINRISQFGSRTISLVRVRLNLYANTNVTQEGGSRTHRVAHESYEPHDDNDRAMPGFRDQVGKAESIEDVMERI